jgi:hypothetical protein
VNHYLMVFDRVEGRVLRLAHCENAVLAMRARFEAERSYGAAKNIEIVVLGAQSEAELRETHARYFEDAGQLTMTGLSRADRVAAAAQ